MCCCSLTYSFWSSLADLKFVYSGNLDVTAGDAKEADLFVGHLQFAYGLQGCHAFVVV